MPLVYVYLDSAARLSYIETYKAKAISRVDAHMDSIINSNFIKSSFLETVYNQRALQAYAYLNDPDGDANIIRYPVISAGVPSYGATHQEVAEAYLTQNNIFAMALHNLFEDHRHVVNEYIPAQTDKPQIDYLVDTFISEHGTWD